MIDIYDGKPYNGRLCMYKLFQIFKPQSMVNTTNVQPQDLNYDKYKREIYDEDIRRSIPGHDQLHVSIVNLLNIYRKKSNCQKILELGIGTGITAEKVLSIYPDALLTGIDFSDQMIKGAKERLTKYQVKYIVADYSEINFEEKYDMVVSVIGMHHQTDEGKRKMFQKVFDCLTDNGIFILGDLFTFRDKNKAAVNEARHYHHLVEHARDEKALEEWAYHHKFLNLIAPLEDQTEWLKDIGFKEVEVEYEYLNTALMVGFR